MARRALRHGNGLSVTRRFHYDRRAGRSKLRGGPRCKRIGAERPQVPESVSRQRGKFGGLRCSESANRRRRHHAGGKRRVAAGVCRPRRGAIGSSRHGLGTSGGHVHLGVHKTTREQRIKLFEADGLQVKLPRRTPSTRSKASGLEKASGFSRARGAESGRVRRRSRARSRTTSGEIHTRFEGTRPRGGDSVCCSNCAKAATFSEKPHQESIPQGRGDRRG